MASEVASLRVAGLAALRGGVTGAVPPESALLGLHDAPQRVPCSLGQLSLHFPEHEPARLAPPRRPP
eukprot:2755752-Lingulodinium_polyedra.AAC.1